MQNVPLNYNAKSVSVALVCNRRLPEDWLNVFLTLICDHPHNSPCWSFPSTIQPYPYLKTKQGLHWVVEHNEFPWFERDPGEKNPGSMCFKYNFKPMQLFSQTSAASYVSLHLHGKLKINWAIREPVDVLAGEHAFFFLIWRLRLLLWKNSLWMQECGAQITTLTPAC